jgi:pSer/pThr/pTyr-binding forkhead associated (FHA) protein
MMAKVRICPNCGRSNAEYADWCAHCPTSLDRVTAVPIQSGSSMPPAASAELPSPVPSSPARTKRLPSGQAELHSMDVPALTFHVSPGVTVGRGGEVDLSSVPRSDYISQRHARIDVENDAWCLEDLGSPNRSYVNGRPVPEHQKTGIADGDTITLANSSFVFRVR